MRPKFSDLFQTLGKSNLSIEERLDTMSLQNPEQQGENGAPTRNLLRTYELWSKAGPEARIIYRLHPDTCTFIQETGIASLPEKGPEHWTNGSLIMESAGINEPLFDSVTGLNVLYSEKSDLGYPVYLFLLIFGGGLTQFYINADSTVLNERLKKSGRLFERVFLDDLNLEDDDPERRRIFAKAIEFTFVFSSLLKKPEMILREREPSRTRRKKGARRYRNQNESPVWRYDTIGMSALLKERRTENVGIGASLIDRPGLTLTPTEVRGFFRTRNGQEEYVGKYDGSRWKRDEQIGTKKTI